MERSMVELILTDHLIAGTIDKAAVGCDVAMKP
jgi:hypothetical protein